VLKLILLVAPILLIGVGGAVNVFLQGTVTASSIVRSFYYGLAMQDRGDRSPSLSELGANSN
jgi:hypothetical protein